MDEPGISVRQARADDAGHVARVYIESWQDTYPSVLPQQMLAAMPPRGQTARWRAAILAKGRENVLVAEIPKRGIAGPNIKGPNIIGPNIIGPNIIGMTSFGPSRDGDLGFDGEGYTLYVDPAFYGRGAGRALLRTAFATLGHKGFGSCVIWAHAKNNARFFYEAMGGRLIAERTARMMGDAVPEAAFGWRRLALAERAHP